jgi:hypothetical protein
VSTATDGHGFEMVQNTVFDIILLDWCCLRWVESNYAKP